MDKVKLHFDASKQQLRNYVETGSISPNKLQLQQITRMDLYEDDIKGNKMKEDRSKLKVDFKRLAELGNL